MEVWFWMFTSMTWYLCCVETTDNKTTAAEPNTTSNETSTNPTEIRLYDKIMIAGSSATFGLTFVAVVGICCILSRLPKKKQDSVIEMQRTEDEAATDHFEDWHNIKLNANNHFSQTDEDTKRDTIIGAIYPI